MTWTFKKLSYEKKLGLYFSLVTSLILKCFRPEFQVKQIKEIKERVFFLEGNSDHPCLVCTPNVCGVCRESLSIGTRTKNVL